MKIRTVIIIAIGIAVLIAGLFVLVKQTSGNGIWCFDACGPCSSYGTFYVEVDGKCVLPDNLPDNLLVIEETPGSTLKGFIYTLDVESKGFFEIKGSIEGAKLSEITFDEHTNQVTVSLVESQDGQLTITVPRKLFETNLGNDIVFMVLINNGEAAYSETANESDSTLTIRFPAKTKEIWIIGAFHVSQENPIPDNAILQVVAEAPCAWMTLHELPHSELLKRHDRTGRNALMLKITDDDINKVPHLKEMFVALQNESGFQQYENGDNAWVKRINSTESEQQKIWDWLKETSDSQFGKRSDDSFTTYFTYEEKFYQITWALC